MRVGPDGVLLDEAGAAGPDVTAADTAEPMLADLLASLRDLHGKLNRHALTPSDLTQWFDTQVESERNRHRLEALRAVEALDVVLRNEG